ncbi:MAG: glycosyltransferase [Paracoccaceae bacterium]|nr:glycosyltransferase [Paracoccaceae bacterium]
MVKEPRPGRVKTRLARDIGAVDATWWYRHQVRSLLRRLRDPRWRLVLAVDPDPGALRSRDWPFDVARIGQGRGDLGARMIGSLRQAPGPAVLIGSDIPGVSRPHIAGAFRLLGAAPAVLGPSSDGGYWLIGLRHPRRVKAQALEGVPWSHGETLSATRPRLPGPVALADTLDDIDTAADLTRYLAAGKPVTLP